MFFSSHAEYVMFRGTDALIQGNKDLSGGHGL